MRWIEVTKSKGLRGDIIIPGSKNSSIALLTGCCLCDETITLNNIPNISDIDVICDICRDLGVEIHRDADSITVNSSKIYNTTLDPLKSSSYRAAYYFIGALLAKYKKVSLGYPGGDNFGSRPIDQHIKAFEALGAKFTFYNDYYVVEADRLIGADIYFDVITSGATINILLASVLAEGRTILRNAARDPEIVDLAIFLNRMGAKIKGAGTDKVVIDGVSSLIGVHHSVIPDRLIAGSMLMSAGITGGCITTFNSISEHLLPCIAKLEEAGLNIEAGDNFIKAYLDASIKGVIVKTGMYPSFSTDLQQPMTSLLTRAQSHSVIVDNVYSHRFKNCIELNKMGADIIIKDGSVVIPGGRTLKGTWVHASDVRAGISLILAGLNAEGITRITGIEHIERGYDSVVDTFKTLGANINIFENESLDIIDLDTDTDVV